MKQKIEGEKKAISFDNFSKTFVNPKEFKEDFSSLTSKLQIFSIKYGKYAVMQLIKQITIYD